ncbi:MAG: site-specific integrase [Pseudomonadales bacterium]|nr:site-specific integrase [Pseudomonadales bacterium]
MKGHPPQSATFARLTDAKKWIQDTESAIREGRYFKKAEARKKTLHQLIERYKETVLPTKPRSAYEQRYQLDWWDDELGDYFLVDVTPAVVSEAKDRLLRTKSKQGKQLSPSTVVRYMAALSHAFTVATKEWQWVDENPFRNVSRPKEPRGRVRFLEKAEIQNLRDACRESSSPFLETIFVISISTGMRKGEILGLKWDEVDLSRKMIYINDPKNGQRRAVPLTGDALTLMRQLTKVRYLNTDLVFPGVRKRDKPAKIDNHWAKALEEAGIENYRFHDNRHTAASYLAMNGASLSEIAEILGHKTLSMVQRYAHLSEAHTAKVVSRMNKAIFD